MSWDSLFDGSDAHLLDEFCEWTSSETGSARYQTSCGKSVLSTGPDNGDECCCCDRPIKVKQKPV